MIALGFVSVFAASCGASKDARSSDNSPAAAARFAQDFYDWYVPIASAQKSEPASNAVLNRNPPVLAPELLRELQEDAAAQAKSQEIVGIDFDPFLNSQDPCERYEVGTVRETGGNYQVDVHSICSGKRSEKPDVVAEMIFQNGSWLFANFRRTGGEGGDLRTILKQLARDRKGSQ
jgi:hypothetical protein